MRSRPSSGQELRWALAYVLPYWHRLALVLVLSLIGTLSSLALPYLSKALVDDALLGRSTTALVRIVAAFAALSLASFALNVWSGLRYTRVSAEILFDMRLDLYHHLQQLSPRYFARTPAGEILSRLNNDIGEIQRIVADTALAWLGHVLYLAGTVALLVWLDWRLFLLSLVVLPPALGVLVRYRTRLEGSVQTLRSRSARIGTFLVETLRGMRLVVAANAQQRELDRFRRENDAFIAALMAMRRLTFLAGGLPGLLLTLGMMAVFLYGGSRVIAGAITMGTLVAFTAYQARLLVPVQGLMGLYTNVAIARVSLHRVHEILAVQPEVTEAAGVSAPETVRGHLAFEDVSLGYPRGGAVLDGVSFELEAGSMLAVVGESGAGKSTLADLALRLVDPDRGRVLLDGRDLRDWPLQSVRGAIAVVDHAAFVFHSSLRENVAYARPSAADADLVRALEEAGLGPFVAALPDGLDTVLGEAGQELSAGERQRVAIARALLADPRVVVLDEATATLDPHHEAQVLRSYDPLRRNRSFLLITHRLELARRADRIVVLGGGRVVAAGTPAELLAERGGPLRRLFPDAVPADDPGRGARAEGARS